jgi:hypothetical protein
LPLLWWVAWRLQPRQQLFWQLPLLLLLLPLHFIRTRLLQGKIFMCKFSLERIMEKLLVLPPTALTSPAHRILGWFVYTDSNAQRAGHHCHG